MIHMLSFGHATLWPALLATQVTTYALLAIDIFVYYIFPVILCVCVFVFKLNIHYNSIAESVWVFARERIPDGPVLQTAYGILDKYKISRTFFVKTDQTNCETEGRNDFFPKF